jgi:adenylosuccinate lyase
MQQEPTALRMPDPGIRELFSEAQRFQSWLDVEAALAQAQAELDVIPSDAAEEITRKARIELLDMDAIYEGLARTGHGLVPLIWELDRVCDGEAGGLVHWGATTQNITQTGKLLQLRKAHRIYLDQLARILEMLADLAELTRDFALPGRTHGQHAVPATFGLKVAVWIDELVRHVERLRGCEDRVFVAMLGGGAGTLGSLGEIGMDIQERMAEKLDLNPMSMPSRTTVDHLCEYVVLLGMLSATCSKIGREVYTLMKQEFGELEEPVPPGTVGSSTMPQKRNPKVSQDIVAGAAQVRALVPLALEAMMTEHEADRTTSVMMDRALTQAAIAVGDILQYMIELFSGLQVFPDRMRQNLDLSGGLIMSEALMLELGRRIGRQRAHDVIYDAAQASVVENRPFTETLSDEKEVLENLTADQIEALLDPTQYTGACGLLSDQFAAQARSIAADISGSA